MYLAPMADSLVSGRFNILGYLEGLGQLLMNCRWIGEGVRAHLALLKT